MKKYIFFGGKTIGNFILQRLLEDGFSPNANVCYRNHLSDELIRKAEESEVDIK